MLQKIKALDEKLDKLDEINNNKFFFEKFTQVNNQIETMLVEIKSNELSSEQNSFSSDHLNIFKNLLNKIDRLESKILYKANLFKSFSKSSS